VIGYTKDFTPNEYALAFDEYRGTAKGSVIEGAIDAGGINAAVGSFGRGRVVVFGSHPEFGYSLEMDDYQTPARLLANAVLWQSAHAPSNNRDEDRVDEGSGREPPTLDLSSVARRTAAVHAIAAELLAKDADPSPSWLSTRQAQSTFGLAPDVIWRRALAGFELVGDRLLRTALHVQELARTAGDEGREIVSDLERAIRYEAPAEWDQDFGYQGLLKTLEMTESLLRQAVDNFSVDLADSPDPYEHDDVSPYHLVAASYYSALGLYLSAWCLLRVHEVRLEDLHLLRASGHKFSESVSATAGHPGF
jgi:hypothetical protein